MPVFISILIFFVLVSVLFFSRLQEKEVQGRYWMLLRALFPSWRFFEDLDWVPILHFRILASLKADPGPWIEYFPPEPRPLSTFFLNSRGNFRMAANSLLEQFATDISEMDSAEVSGSVSYRLVSRLVRFRIRELNLTGSGQSFQFRVGAGIPGSAEQTEIEPLLLSEVQAL